MIDLHLHFDGSLTEKSILRLAGEQGIKLPEAGTTEFKTMFTAPEDCSSLNEYLEKFDLPLKLLQTEKAVETAMRDLLEQLKSEGIRYAEIRFAPQLHTAKGMSMRQVIEAASRPILEHGTSFEHGASCFQLILCCMRGAENQKENMETVELASEFLGRGVAAVDLAGAEAVFPTENFKTLFDAAKEKKVPYTIHAGEAAGADSIWKALSFGTKRIGHGIHANEDAKLLDYLKNNDIFLECCPVSNTQTKAVPSMKENPVLSYLRMGIHVTINTDNRTVSDTTIAKEFCELEKYLGLTAEEKKQCLKNSVQAAFLRPEQKKQLWNEIEQERKG